jgi:hypothetical protein
VEDVRKREGPPSAIEIEFAPTPDGLVVDRIFLRPATSAAEVDLRRFLARFRDPDVDLGARVREGRP